MTVNQPPKAAIEKARRMAYAKSRNIDPNAPMQLSMLFPALAGKETSFMPNDLGRSALFTARDKRVPRENLVHEKLFHLHENVTIYYTGSELRAYDDELVWQQILRYAREQPLGHPVHFTVKQLVADLGWSKSGQRYDAARVCISRLKATELLVINERAFGSSGGFSLIDKYIAINDTGIKPVAYSVWIDPAMITLFAGSTFTNHHWPIYRDLTPTARRLADYVESHRIPNPLPVERFANLCGSVDQSTSSQAQTARKACRELEEAGIVVQAFVKKGMIYTYRTQAALTQGGRQ